MNNFTAEEILKEFSYSFPMIFSLRTGTTLAIPVSDVNQAIKAINLDIRWVGYEKLTQTRIIEAFQLNGRMALTKAAGGTGIKDDANENFLFTGSKPVVKSEEEDRAHMWLEKTIKGYKNFDNIKEKLYKQLSILELHHDFENNLQQFMETRIKANKIYTEVLEELSKLDKMFVPSDRQYAIGILNEFKTAASNCFKKCDSFTIESCKKCYCDGKYHPIGVPVKNSHIVLDDTFAILTTFVEWAIDLLLKIISNIFAWVWNDILCKYWWISIPAATILLIHYLF